MANHVNSCRCVLNRPLEILIMKICWLLRGPLNNTGMQTFYIQGICYSSRPILLLASRRISSPTVKMAQKACTGACTFASQVQVFLPLLRLINRRKSQRSSVSQSKKYGNSIAFPRQHASGISIKVGGSRDCLLEYYKLNAGCPYFQGSKGNATIGWHVQQMRK